MTETELFDRKDPNRHMSPCLHCYYLLFHLKYHAGLSILISVRVISVLLIAIKTRLSYRIELTAGSFI